MKQAIALITGLAFFAYGIVIYFAMVVDKEIDVIKSKVGNQVIIGRDTSIITDYSLLLDNYTLSNGTKISTELANKISTK